jgi:hypothetical protein
VRVLLQGHAPFHAAAKTMYDTLKALRDGATAADLSASVASPTLMRELTAQDEYDQAIARYLMAHEEG